MEKMLVLTEAAEAAGVVESLVVMVENMVLIGFGLLMVVIVVIVYMIVKVLLFFLNGLVLVMDILI